MKRFLVMSGLLILTLLVARAAQGSDWNFDTSHDEFDEAGPTVEAQGFFDHHIRAGLIVGLEQSIRGDDAPRRRGDRIRFRYRDRGYVRVFLAGEIAGDEWIEMEYDPGIDRWETAVVVDPGRWRYHFVVEERGGRQRERTDPANPRRRRDADLGWVSELTVTRKGDVVFDEPRHRRNRWRDDDFDFDPLRHFSLGYQRVDGLVLSARPAFSSRGEFSPALELFAGYGFSSDEWSTQLSFVVPLMWQRQVRAVISAYDKTDYTDRTMLGDIENSAATLLFREDGRDWFRREGLSVGLEAEVGAVLGRVEMRSDTHESQDRRVIAGWGGREDFRPNPAIDEGLLRSLFVRLRIGQDLDHLWVEFEHADDAMLPTEYEFTRFEAQYRSRLRLGHEQHLDVRIRYGRALDGSLVRQKRFLAGGIGTVRGVAYQSLLDSGELDAEGVYGGEQMLLANAEYVMGADSDFAVAFFVDAGNVWLERDADLDLGTLVTSAGVGLLIDGDDDEGLRIDLARELDRDAATIVQLRLRRPF